MIEAPSVVSERKKNMVERLTPLRLGIGLTAACSALGVGFGAICLYADSIRPNPFSSIVIIEEAPTGASHNIECADGRTLVVGVDVEDEHPDAVFATVGSDIASATSDAPGAGQVLLEQGAKSIIFRDGGTEVTADFVGNKVLLECSSQ